ncbi:hypothetical protein P152DRAFT_402501 [Eremomyces bilateralis CBS 781.70]|uniref:GOLD domain-containing protein n=1 Tax=Eremomyces bilateralis CBS 781.70 TaxID=1392243 RepID=A0A6G1FVZ0_9PEZI|nr:uncharacterized protein P152DRAFT_402501 [Eremomyces bilateralis CBS 781.70]KAF1809943.1 hypothetical protein P152DRAFT_402501 [Eremomyces bilateralis CBS 781.70]
MARETFGRPRIGQFLSYLLFAILILPSHALHFFIDSAGPKCFYEELPKDTMVVGDYKAERFSEQTGKYEIDNHMKVYISVEEVFDNDHRIVSQHGDAKGRFTFSAADSGDHRLCFVPTPASIAGSWLSGGHPDNKGIKFTLDMVIGETSAIESNDKGKLQDIVTRVRDLNGRLQDIRREQVFQRERESEFRDQSESTNAKVVKWTLVQLVILGVTCAWQLSHLRSFFIKQKLT